MHKNPVNKKWQLVNAFTDYLYSSASYQKKGETPGGRNSTNYLTTYLNCNLTDLIFDMSIWCTLKYVKAW